MSFIETDEIRAEAAQLANEMIEHCVRWGKERYAKDKPFKTDHLDEGAYVDHLVASLRMDPLNYYELTEVRALVYYVCREQNMREENMFFILQDKFKIAKIEHIQRQYFQQVVKFLGDLLNEKSA
jgi:hypothetical protein